MDIQNNSIVTDADTEILDGEITQISNDFSETYYFDGEQEEELEMLVAKAMKLGELHERKKWQAAKAQAVPECVWVGIYDGSVFESSCGHTFELSNDGTLDDNNMKHCCFCGGKIEAQEPAND